MVFVADARECRFLMKPKVKPKVVLSASISSSRRRFADDVVATWDLLCIPHVGWLLLSLVVHKLPPVGRTYVNINASYCSTIHDAYVHMRVACAPHESHTYRPLATWDRPRRHLGRSFMPHRASPLADARECRFLMKPKVKPKVVL